MVLRGLISALGGALVLDATGAVVRDLGPDWPLTWSPDGAGLVYLSGTEHHPAGRAILLPAFLADGDLLAADDCCIFQRLVRRDLDTGATSG